MVTVETVVSSSAGTSLSPDDLPQVFADLTPIEQDDGPAGVARIEYPENFEIAYDYFRAVLEKDERSERALKLTALCLTMNPANYTVWHFRRLCLEALGKLDAASLVQDFALAAELGGENPKNYQIWYHRRALLEQFMNHKPNTDDKEILMDLCRKELTYTASVFRSDSKNYHSWCYRQWVLKMMNLEEVWKEELEYVQKLVQEDVRNNSAWNQRWFVAHRGDLQKALSTEEATREAEYALDGARQDPYNESPWRYLLAVLKEQIKHMDDREKTVSLLSNYIEKVTAIKAILEEAGRDPEACPNLTALVVDLLECKGDAASLQTALDLTDKLARDMDPIREKYWNFRSEQLKAAKTA